MSARTPIINKMRFVKKPINTAQIPPTKPNLQYFLINVQIAPHMVKMPRKSPKISLMITATFKGAIRPIMVRLPINWTLPIKPPIIIRIPTVTLIFNLLMHLL